MPNGKQYKLSQVFNKNLTKLDHPQDLMGIECFSGHMRFYNLLNQMFSYKSRYLKNNDNNAESRTMNIDAVPCRNSRSLSGERYCLENNMTFSDIIFEVKNCNLYTSLPQTILELKCMQLS